MDESEARVEDAVPERLLKQRAKSGIFFVGSFGAVNLVVSFAGSLVLARMLVPSDFGVVAIGTTLMMVATALGDGGLASGLIRREEAPSLTELRAALGIQLLLTGVLAVSAASVGIALGGSGLVVALMMAALPISALQSPGRIVLSRELRFRALAGAETASMLVYYGWAVAWVIAGLGVWALASAVAVRAIALAVGVARVSRLGMMRPSLRHASALRPVIRFGVQFQAVSLAGMGREQGLNVGIAAIAGVATLGFWSITQRLLALPVLVFEPIHRVMFPLMSQMRAAGRDLADTMERGIAVAGAASGLLLVSFAAAAPELVPAVFGEQWRPVGPILQWVCGGLLVAAPLSVIAVGFLYSANEPSVVLRATILHTVGLYAVAFSLLPVLGPEAIGMGSFTGGVVDAAIMARAIRTRSSARPLAAHLPTLAVAAPAAALGMIVTWSAGTGLMAAAAGGVVAGSVYLALTALFRRAVFLDAARLIADAVRSGFRREAPASPQPDRAQGAPVPAASA